MEVRSKGVAAVLGLLSLLWTSPASAWTDARARSVRVVVDVARDGTARVSMELQLQVRGGWLEGFEVSGLDPDATLDTLKPPVLVSDEGEKWAPEARVRRGGRVVLSFARRGSPRRGRYRLYFHYVTSLAHRATEPRPDQRTRFTWTLPAWETGLEDVDVWIWTPSRNAEGVHAEGLKPPEQRRTRERSLLRFHRMHLPRATSWPVAFEEPNAALDPSLWVDHPQAASNDAGSVLRVARPRQVAWRPALWLSLCAMCFAWSHRAHARRQGRRVRYLLGSPLLAIAAALACVTASAAVPPEHGIVLRFVAAAACFSMAAPLSSGPRFGQWQRVGAAEIERARWRQRLGWLGLSRSPDPVSAVSLVPALLTGALVVETWHPTGDLFGWLAPCAALALVWSPRRWGRDYARSLRRLAALAGALRGSGMALAFRAFHPAAGEPLQPRLVVHPSTRVSGLLRLEVGPDQRRTEKGFVVLATTALDSSTDGWLRTLGGTRRVSPGARRACHMFTAHGVHAVQQQLDRIVSHCAEQAHRVVVRAA